VSAETVRRYMNKYLARQARPRKRASLTIKHVRARPCFAKQWVRESWHNVVVTDIKYFWLYNNKGPGNKEWVLFEDEPPTKVSEQNCFKVHAYGGVSKYSMTPMKYVNMSSSWLNSYRSAFRFASASGNQTERAHICGSWLENMMRYI
jgi:hypothetical protein